MPVPTINGRFRCIFKLRRGGDLIRTRHAIIPITRPAKKAIALPDGFNANCLPVCRLRLFIIFAFKRLCQLQIGRFSLSVWPQSKNNSADCHRKESGISIAALTFSTGRIFLFMTKSNTILPSSPGCFS